MQSEGGQQVAHEWPVEDLVQIAGCPICKSADRTLLHQGAEDWAFGVAPGRWDYWLCGQCKCVYLSPRPTAVSIGRAYRTYYTHSEKTGDSLFGRLRARWKNERLSCLFNRPVGPGLGLPRILRPWVESRASRLDPPFGWREIVEAPAGRLLDVGCGAGSTMSFAQSQGWEVLGIEPDERAVAHAQTQGLSVHSGGYELMRRFAAEFDCVVCSHVIEHVFDPRDLIGQCVDVLKPGGRLILSTPNASSRVHRQFGPYWRGLEAPRHLVLFSLDALRSMLEETGFDVDLRGCPVDQTVRGSSRIARGVKKKGRITSDRIRSAGAALQGYDEDFINIVAVRR